MRVRFTIERLACEMAIATIQATDLRRVPKALTEMNHAIAGADGSPRFSTERAVSA